MSVRDAEQGTAHFACKLVVQVTRQNHVGQRDAETRSEAHRRQG